MTLNTILIIIAAMVNIVILPNYLGLELYSEWQMYVIVLTYLPILSFGIGEGLNIIARNEIKNKVYVVEIYILFILIFIILLILTIPLLSIINNFLNNIKMSSVAIITMYIIVLRSIPLFYFQTTGKINKYANAISLEKLIFIFSIIATHSMGYLNVLNIVYIDLSARLISFIYVVFQMENIKSSQCISSISFNNILSKLLIYIKTGVRIQLSFYISMSALIVYRLIIEDKFGKINFSEVSIVIGIVSLGLMIASNIAVITYSKIIHNKWELKKFNIILKIVFIPYLCIGMASLYSLTILIPLIITDSINLSRYILIIGYIGISEFLYISVYTPLLKAKGSVNFLLLLNLIPLVGVFIIFIVFRELVVSLEIVTMIFVSLFIIKLVLAYYIVNKTFVETLLMLFIMIFIYGTII